MISKRYRYDSKSFMNLNEIQQKAKLEIENKLKNNTYHLEKISCQICGSNQNEVLSEKDRYGLFNRVVVCKNCGLVYTNPRLTQDSYNKFYDTEYRRLYGGRNFPTKAAFYSQYIRGIEIFDFIKNTCPEVKFDGLKVLEIGCAAGGILQYFNEKGCITKGVDLDSAYLTFGKENYNLDLTHGTLMDVTKGFIPDLVIYSHVIEHILNINAELQILKERCSEKTMFYIEVPGIKNIHNAYKMDALTYFQNAHTFHFSLTTLNNLFKKHGFKLNVGDEYVRSIFSINHKLDKPSFKNDYSSVLKYLKKIEKNRFMFYFKYSTIKKKIKSLLKKRAS